MKCFWNEKILKEDPYYDTSIYAWLTLSLERSVKNWLTDSSTLSTDCYFILPLVSYKNWAYFPLLLFHPLQIVITHYQDTHLSDNNGKVFNYTLCTGWTRNDRRHLTDILKHTLQLQNKNSFRKKEQVLKEVSH